MLHIIALAAAWAQPIGPFYAPSEYPISHPTIMIPETAIPSETIAEPETEPPTINGTWLDGRACLIGGECTTSKLQYDWAEAQGVQFVHTNAMYTHAVQTGRFVRLSHPRLRVIARRPHVLASTATFVYELAEAYYNEGCGRLTVTGAGRLTSERPSNGSVHSVHPAGMAVDLRVINIGERCESWLASFLMGKEASGEVDATREYHPPHFHLVVPQIEKSGRVYLAATYQEADRPEQ